MEPLDLKRVQTFLAVVQTGSFKRAADRLNTTQPAVSNRITQLERSLGVRLLDRTTRSCRPTARGRSLVDYANRIFALTTELRAEIAQVEAISGLVRLGVVEAISLTWLPELIAEMEARMPRLRLDIEVDLSSKLLPKLEAHELDAACIVAPAALDGMTSEPLGEIGLGWVASTALPIAETPVTARILAEHSILMQTGARHGPAIERWVRAAGWPPRRVTLCNSISAMIKLAVRGAGVALIPAAAATPELRAGLLRVLPAAEPLPANRFAVVHLDEGADVSVRAAVEMVKDAAYRAGASAS
jgi:DNA-binding transcriptional LysR family regulator